VSLAAGLAIVMIGIIWAGIVEMLRVGNQHLSFRGTRLPWHQQYLQAFLAAVVAFWSVLFMSYAAGRMRRSKPDRRHHDNYTLSGAS
jgi:hypothetical protein